MFSLLFVGSWCDLLAQGVQWLNGEAKTEAKLKEVSKYVQQEESLLGALTVKEVFESAALFYQKDPAHR